MKELVEFTLESGGSVWVEVETVPGSGQRGGPVSFRNPAEKVAEAVVPTFEAALDKVRPVADAVITKLKGLATAPDQIQVEFGLKLTAQAGAIIAAAGGEANFKVALTWKRPESR